MKFRKISERVRGGKLDPLSKMGKSKLTGQEVAKYYKDNPKAKMAAKDKTVKKAIELALDLGGSYTQAIKEIEKLKRGLSKMPVVQQALKTANEDMTSTTSVAMPDGIPLGKVKKTKVLKRKDLEENKEKLSPAKAQYKKFNIMRTKLYRFVKAKTKAHKFAIDDLMLMTSPKVIEGMYKQNPRGFTRMMDKMYPNENGKLDKGDFTVLGDFIDARGKVIKGKGDVSESTSLDENTMTYRVKDMRKPEMDKFTSSAKLMKLKMQVKRSPRGKETLITMSGNKKQLRDFDAVARGKSSYGDPSLIEDAVERAKEMADLKAKHKREAEQEKDEIQRTKDTATEDVLAQLNSLEEQLDLLEKQYNEESATMKKVRQVVKKKGMMNIDGMKLDLTTASMISSVYDKVNPMNKKRMDKLKLPQLVNLTMKVAGKSRKESVKEAVFRHDFNSRPNPKMMKKSAMDRVKQLNLKVVKPKNPKSENDLMFQGSMTNLKKLKKLFKIESVEEAVSPAQQAAIAISKKERGEKPKNECADEKDFKPHKMYKGDKEVMANTYADHMKLGKMGYTHEKPKSEALDAKDKPLNTESMSRAKADAMRDMGKRKDKDDDGYGVATKDDRKAADKNVVMQIRKVTDLQRPAQIELRNGKKVMLKPADAKMMMKKFDAIRKPQDRLKVQNAMNDKKMTVQGLKRLLGK